jgi:hypothetical protein
VRRAGSGIRCLDAKRLTGPGVRIPHAGLNDWSLVALLPYCLIALLPVSLVALIRLNGRRATGLVHVNRAHLEWMEEASIFHRVRTPYFFFSHHFHRPFTSKPPSLSLPYLIPSRLLFLVYVVLPTSSSMLSSRLSRNVSDRNCRKLLFAVACSPCPPYSFCLAHPRPSAPPH